MPCMKCANGKYKYGEHGKCVYSTLEKCQQAAAAIHIGDKTLPASNKGDDFISMQEMFGMVNNEPYQPLKPKKI